MQAKLAIAGHPRLRASDLRVRKTLLRRRQFRLLALMSAVLDSYRASQAKAVARAMRAGLASIE
jgi:hypothetical protein